MPTLATNIVFQYNSPDGKPLAGGKVYTYEAHTTTLKETYTDAQGSAVNTNPVILDESGQANIYFGDGAYRVIIHDIDGVLMTDIPSISRYVTFSELEAFQNEVGLSISKLDVIQEQINTYVDNALIGQKGSPGGITPLGVDGKVQMEYLPDLTTILFAPIPYPKATPPDGFLLMDGRSIPQVQYPILFSLYGANLPDLRGMFIRGWDNGRGFDPGRSLLGYQADDFRQHNHTSDPKFNKLGVRASDLDSAGTPTAPDSLGAQLEYRIAGMGNDLWAAATIRDTGGAETRPKNIAFNYIVKAG